MDTLTSNASNRHLGSKTVPTRPSPAAPRPQHPFGAMRLELSRGMRRLAPPVQNPLTDRSATSTTGPLAVSMQDRPVPSHIAEHEEGNSSASRDGPYRANNTAIYADLGPNPFAFHPGRSLYTPQLQSGQSGFPGTAPVVYQNTYLPPNVYSMAMSQPRVPFSATQPLAGNKRQRQIANLGEDHYDYSTVSTPTQNTPAPKKRLSTLTAPSATTPAHDSSQAVPSTTGKLQVPGRRRASEERDGTYRGESPEQDTPRQSIEGGSAYKTRLSRRKADADAAVAPARPQDLLATLTVNGFLSATDSHTGNPVASTFGVYAVPPQLHGIRAALGEASWKEYVDLVEKVIDCTISEDNFDAAERRMFHSFNEKMRMSIRKKMIKMVEAASSTQGN
ncbi:uncharacterized protein N0V89_007555 [Didymosphaeria variabile]|uniref:Uncharacterized protein n=1 Tax=Didymosphaeria variabile TaxID=1932322 RepID=A0A9W9CAD4_9PLEO|nr:uncharacterized protein N0V89_007555 [Didymosphaeria variabile]KAJ4352208.1 hypothetical protein N0V89_007555 [Didymosphaeria variabile]